MDWWSQPRNISIVVDTPGWYDRFAEHLVEGIAHSTADAVRLVRSAEEVMSGGVAMFLSCCKLTPERILERNHINIVVHASALPKGRGFSPIVYQVIEGASVIPISMIEAVAEADAGDILLQSELELEGHELNDEIRDNLGNAVNNLILDWLCQPSPYSHRRKQEGDPSWYPRRRPEDSRLDPQKSIAEQFDHLRVVDNDSYPAFFDYRGHRYTLRIERDGD